MSKIKYITLLGWTAILLLFSSCDSFLTIEEPEDKTITEGYYNSDQRVEQAVIGIYVDFRRALMHNRAWLMYGEARSSELTVDADCYKYVSTQDLTADNNELIALTDWEFFYDALRNANEVLDIIDNVEEGILSEYKYNLFKGEALALKSLAYFYLARIWGDIPSAEKANYRTVITANEAIQMALEMATQADALLPWLLTNEDGIESASLTATRMNKTAIRILLAQENLWMNNDVEAFNILKTAIEENTAGTWSEFGFSMGDDMRFDISDNPLDAKVVSISLEKLNEIYPDGDLRRNAFDINYNTETASMLDYTQDVTRLMTMTNFNLLYSEAAFKTGQLELAVGSLVGISAGATEDYSTLTSETFMDALILERQRLLMGSGMRFFDLIRFGKVADVIPEFSADDVANGAAYYPLSERSIKDNSLNQNSYWSN